jgi:hypothetical protein
MEWDLTKSKSLITFEMSASEAHDPEVGGSNLPPLMQEIRGHNP